MEALHYDHHDDVDDDQIEVAGQDDHDGEHHGAHDGHDVANPSPDGTPANAGGRVAVQGRCPGRAASGRAGGGGGAVCQGGPAPAAPPGGDGAGEGDGGRERPARSVGGGVASGGSPGDQEGSGGDQVGSGGDQEGNGGD